ncbi:sarcosine oxidase subunit alpha family protein [Primorskyibacter sp. S187A]|uniref:sarcosine oxidase subunit alpha family protein n=1 Tax=Primorskyibacter sp. S187A TaxID=3415130 RepID=UPI003C7EB501
MRVDGKGRINRSKTLSFSFDGIRYEGFQGDTLASALLANDIRLVARSFKYHRPRGILTAGSEEPNALVTIGRGDRRDPNMRATTQELFEGLEARSQNAWPSVGFDALAINDFAAPFLSAGFYYKTFMWPRAFWEKLYEPVIRRAAGLGALSGEPDGDVYERGFLFCDVLVIGAGPAGLMAAYTAAQGGADVILATEDTGPGGRLLSEDESVGDLAGADWAAEISAKLEEMDNVRLMTRTAITGAYDQGTYGAWERVGHHLPAQANLPKSAFWRIATTRAILAAGALERPIAFANNDRPGIMMASAVRSYLHRYGVSPGARVAVFGNNDSAHRTARDLRAAGVHVTALIDARPEAPDLEGISVLRGAVVTNSSGRRGLEDISVAFDDGRTDRITADCLAVSGGWNPSVHLTCHLSARPVWNEALSAFVPAPGAVPGLEACGAAAGVFSTAGCLEDGRRAGLAALSELGRKSVDVALPEAEDAAYRIKPLWAVPGKSRAWLDFQNDVTVKDVKQAGAENFRSVEHMKRYTTQGMATDQGKNSNVGALAVLADATGRSIPETGTTTFRPPFSPVPLGAMGASGPDKGFAPERFTTSHAASLARGAPVMEAGLWYRPSYFPQAGETRWQQSCDREVGYVRQSVGICDVSTLGKIDIQGPDAAKLLDFAYCNTFSTLKEGRVRYGLMLREDGHVMDDGTTARLGPTHYVMTTTTAAAGLVMRHLEFIAQVLKPEWDVRFTSVTEQWAQFAVAGPQARALLENVLEVPLSAQDWPFMSCGPVQIGGIAARLFRISFSGEQGYEIAVPARYGAALFEALVARAEEMGGGAYGMEALNVLRIEKGFITHSEIDGRITAFDIGMGRMVSAKKACVGQVMAARPGLLDATRPQLVGLKPVGETLRITAGARLYEKGAEPRRANDQGYVTSNGHSPTLGHEIALGFVSNGPERHGEIMQMVDGLRGIEGQVEICHPVFLDPEGGRMRG